jgi:hypothetical protein
VTSNKPTESDVVSVAVRILDELDLLVGSDAPAFGSRLEVLINKACAAHQMGSDESFAEREDAIYMHLASHNQTRRRLDELLPQLSEYRASYESPYTNSEPGDYDAYVCAECQYTWPVLSIDDPITPPENCPVHQGKALVFRGVRG